MKDFNDTKSTPTTAPQEVEKLIIRLCRNKKTEKSPTMVAAIAKLYEARARF